MGPGVSNCFFYESKFKIKYFIFEGGGGGGWWVGRGAPEGVGKEARVSEFVFSKTPNIKNNTGSGRGLGRGSWLLVVLGLTAL